MIGEVTTVELSPTGIDSDDFDVFSSLRDGADGEGFSSGIDEAVTDGADQFDLVAVAGGEAELPSTEEVSVSIGQTACATCVGCPYLSRCVKSQALAVKQESERQDSVSADMNSADKEAAPNLMEMTPKQSYLERLLAPDDLDSLDENGRGELVMAGYSEPINYQESIIKKAPDPVVSEAKPIDLTTKTDRLTEKIIPQEREGETSTNEIVEVLDENVDVEVAEVSNPSTDIKLPVVDAVSDAAHNDNKKPTPEFLDTPTQTETAAVSVVIDKDAQTVDDNSNSLENETVYPAASDDKVAINVVEVKLDVTAGCEDSNQLSDSIDNERLVDTAIIDEAKVNLPNEQIDVLAADQIFTDTQISSIEQLDYNNVAVEHSHGKDNDFWAEEDAVFFVDQQESPVVESEVSLAEAVTIALPVETITVREETDDYEPVEQVTISTSSIVETIPDVESDEAATKIPEEYLVPREECELRSVKTSEKSNLLRSDDEIESVIMDVSDIKSGINLSGEQAELNDTLDDCTYNGEESAANGDDLLMNTHPSSGLWSDDSRLNPEDGVVSTAQSSADDTSLVSRLVGVFVVAMCVVRGRQARFILNS